MYLLIGATGRTGAAALDVLAAQDAATRVLTRDASKFGVGGKVLNTEVIEGSVRHRDDLARAMRDVACVYLSMGNSPEQEASELAVVEAAEKAGVSRIVKLSAPTAGSSSPVAIARMHGRVEASIVASRIPYVFLRPYAFFQNLANQTEPLAMARCLFASTGEAALNMVDARDVGEVAAQMMLDTSKVDISLELTGDEVMSYTRIAGQLTALSGETYRYVNRTPDAYRSDLLGQGLPDWIAEHVLEIQALTRSHPERPNSNVRDILGRPARHISTYLPELLVMVAARRAAIPGKN